MLRQKPVRRIMRWVKRIVIGLTILVLVVIVGGLAMITFWPDVAAENIDRLRDVIGDAPVAQLETVLLDIQDHVQQLKYQVGLVKPESPWANSTPILITTDSAQQIAIEPTDTPIPDQPEPTSTITSIPADSTQQVAIEPTATPLPVQPGAPTSTIAPTPTDSSQQAAVEPTLMSLTEQPSNPTLPSTLPITATPLGTPVTVAEIQTPMNPTPAASYSTHWQLSPLTPFGRIEGEGQWTPYMEAPDGKSIVAYRTFLQPDPTRPYSVTAVVAFNLHATRLHFVLGTEEPKPLSPQPSRTGMIPTADRQPGVLLATFNGGFKARHGQYGAMADGLVGLPAVRNLATVAMYTDGHVQIGEWGTEIKDSPDLVAWRQNGKMMIHNGVINPDISISSASWGATIKGDVITWRSAIGLSADGQTLYYAAAQEVDVASMAKVLAQAGAAQALELDVNSYWVHFAAIRSNGSTLIAEPLLNGMFQQVDRYLKVSTRDFFYVTAVTH